MGSTLKAKFIHYGTQPGVTISYRVYAQRDNKTSEYSNVASLYVQPSQPALRIAA